MSATTAAEGSGLRLLQARAAHHRKRQLENLLPGRPATSKPHLRRWPLQPRSSLWSRRPVIGTFQASARGHPRRGPCPALLPDFALAGAHPVGELPVHPARYVGAACAAPPTCRGEGRERRATVLGVGIPGHQPRLHQLVDDPADPRPAHHRDRAQLAHGRRRPGAAFSSSSTSYQVIGKPWAACSSRSKRGTKAAWTLSRHPRVRQVFSITATVAGLVRAHALWYNYRASAHNCSARE